ncbi:hypothetical protein OFM13_30215, partial [Escherichia coli]|nr:hypothetical protein [Escherichia coli]
EAKREAIEKIERARLEREKQMESAQELAEPLAEIVDEHRGKKSVEKQDRQQRRERSGSKRKPSETIQEQQLSDDLKPEDVEPQPPEISE